MTSSCRGRLRRFRSALLGVCLALLVVPDACRTEDRVAFSILGECTSPSGLRAILWRTPGREPAGWARTSLSIVPASAPDAAGQASLDAPLAAAFSAAHCDRIRVTWKPRGAVLVEYNQGAVIHYAAPGGVYTPRTPDLWIRYATEGDEPLPRGLTCESGPD